MLNLPDITPEQAPEPLHASPLPEEEEEQEDSQWQGFITAQELGAITPLMGKSAAHMEKVQ